jgi:hypothetical protein
MTSKDIRDKLGIHIEGLQIILSVRDMNASRAFYIDILGFEEVDWGTDDFTSVNRENAGIYLCKGARFQTNQSMGEILNDYPLNLKWYLKNITWLVVCLISYLLAFWVCVINIQEIAERAVGHYTFYSQRAYLGDGEAVIYFGLWTSAFIVLFILSLKNLIRKRIARAGIYALILILLIITSNYIDTLFYSPLP